MQTVEKQGSPSYQDVVQPVTYDSLGREAVKYLPYASGTSGDFQPGFIPKEDASYATSTSPQYQFYQTTPRVVTESQPYAVSIFEKSPSARVIKQGAAGAPWQPVADVTNFEDKSVKRFVSGNTAGEVFRFQYDQNTGLLALPTALESRFYPEDKLHKTRTLDEDNNEVVEFTDRDGKVVCKKVQYGSSSGQVQFASTYYVYDDLSNLILVLQPEAVRIFEQN
jgi:hypothetical protein